MKFIRTIIVPFTLSLLLAACSSEDNSDDTPCKNVEMSRADTEMVADLTDFSFNLFNAYLNRRPESEQNENVAISPIGASFAMAMVANGVEGDTRSEILRTMLPASNNGIEDLNNLMNKILTELPTLDSRVSLSLNNALWVKNIYTPSEAFISELHNNYLAETGVNDFRSDDNVATINNWALQVSAGKVNEIYKPYIIPGMEPSFLVCNLMLFDGKWKKRFNSKFTKIADFLCSDSTVSKIDMMDSDEITFATYDGGDYIAMSIPFGSGAYAANFFLPEEGISPRDLAEVMAEGGWHDYLQMPVFGWRAIKLPKFKMECMADLRESLEECGIKKAFEYSSDFNPMLSNEGSFGSLNQNICVTIDEEGAKLQAVTVGKGELMAYIPKVVEFNRPFLYAIHEQSTGAVLLIGIVNRL